MAHNSRESQRMHAHANPPREMLSHRAFYAISSVKNEMNNEWEINLRTLLRITYTQRDAQHIARTKR